MANSTYEILEFRAVVKPNWTELYILCGPDSDGGVLVGGWYKTTIDPKTPSLDALRDALVNCKYLTEWDRGAPP